MEQVLEREAATEGRKIYDWRDIEMYDDEGNRITNPKTLRSFAEGLELADEWTRRKEREAHPKIDWRDLEMYYDDGRRITNPEILQGMLEAQEMAEAWERRMESYHLEDIFGDFEDDTEEEND